MKIIVSLDVVNFYLKVMMTFIMMILLQICTMKNYLLMKKGLL